MKIYKIKSAIKFPGSIKYWEERYQSGDTSGKGSQGEPAEFKADVINKFVAENTINQIIEFGCGDGNQLGLSKYPKYLGLDVSKSAIKLCVAKFRSDSTKSFLLYEPNYFENISNFLKADLILSLDVIFHLVEDFLFEKYIHDLFKSSKKYVMIYSTNNGSKDTLSHVKHRNFTEFVAKNYPDFKIIKQIKNKYSKMNSPEFFIYEKIS